jgi:hypothetical protein
LCPTRPVTPEVAGSSPVAPASKSACKLSSIVVRSGGAVHAAAHSLGPNLKHELPAKRRFLTTGLCPVAQNAASATVWARGTRGAASGSKRCPSLVGAYQSPRHFTELVP